MCLPCLDPLFDAMKARNPFRKRKAKVSLEEPEKFDRDNIEVPFVLAEKRSNIVSDPGVSDPGLSAQRLSVGKDDETVLTMKKVSSLALV